MRGAKSNALRREAAPALIGARGRPPRGSLDTSLADDLDPRQLRLALVRAVGERRGAEERQAALVGVLVLRQRLLAVLLGPREETLPAAVYPLVRPPHRGLAGRAAAQRDESLRVQAVRHARHAAELRRDDDLGAVLAAGRHVERRRRVLDHGGVRAAGP